ncbi:hypothetical protein QYE76_064989 [Lolium multiflorum]|uniref:F-box domain-containing protein n=1 Tax=Lolium multiflorum TaxID=4521 RepID=A0AAD8S8G4_LOLMU|nr:hypothetical protein QYE76_064989 [Lolium multiflorum]
MDGRTEDQRNTEALLGRILCYIHDVLPGPPASRHSPALSALLALPHHHLDRLSALPDDLLRHVVSRLPVTDAARTAALSRRWRPVWRSAPLVLADLHLLPASLLVQPHVPRHDARRVASAVSRILAAHPGPFRRVHLVTSYTEDSPPGLLARWLHLLAANAVQELVLASRPRSFDLDLQLPAALFRMATLTRLYLGLWKFPDTAASFPNLRELGLCSVVMDCRHMDFILAGCPVLEILCLQGNFSMDRLTLAGRSSIRCVQTSMVSDLEISVEDAPHLDRLIIWSAASTTRRSPRKTINIGGAPALTILGYLDPEVHTLQVGNTIIKAGTRPDLRTRVPSVKILGLKLCLGIQNEAKMLPCILRCFPNVERLHIKSKKTAETTGELNLKFWEESGDTECIRSHINLMVFKNFRGDQSELRFLKFFLERAEMLKELVIVYGKGYFSSTTEANSRVKSLFDTTWASNCCSLVLIESKFPIDEEREILNFKRGSDFSIRDPFSFVVQA